MTADERIAHQIGFREGFEACKATLKVTESTVKDKLLERRRDKRAEAADALSLFAKIGKQRKEYKDDDPDAGAGGGAGGLGSATAPPPGNHGYASRSRPSGRQATHTQSTPGK